MKKLLLVIGIICIIVCVLALLFAGLNMYGYYNVMDGSAELYSRLHARMIASFVVGIVLAVVGLLCLIARSKL